MADLYIYYQVSAANAGVLLPRVRAMQARIARGAGRCQLKHRSSADGATQTWMEVYQQVSSTFEAELADALAKSGIAALIAGARHTEVFTEFNSCA